jgi:hypothetical protein
MESFRAFLARGRFSFEFLMHNVFIEESQGEIRRSHRGFAFVGADKRNSLGVFPDLRKHLTTEM